MEVAPDFESGGRTFEPFRPCQFMIRLWLDDVREPWKHGCIGWTWVKTADEAIELLKTGRVIEASLDHDLSEAATMGCPEPGEKTGYSVVVFMEENNIWPAEGVSVHSLNPVGKARMVQVLARHGILKKRKISI